MTNPTDERSEQDAEWQLAGVAFPHDGRSFTLVPAERIVEAAQSLLKTIADLGRSYRPGDRAAVLEVLAAIHQFLRLPGPPLSLDCYRPLFDLMAALEDLDCGKVSPLVQPREIVGRPPDPRHERIIRAMAAGFVDVLMAAGARERKALRDIAEILHRHGFPFPGMIEGAKSRENTLDNWRRRVREDKTERADVEAYHFTRKDNAPEAGLPLETARARALFTFTGMLEAGGYRKKGDKG